MNKVFFCTLIAHAQSQIKETVPKLVRASNGFLPKESLELAIRNLKECQKILESAKKQLN